MIKGGKLPTDKFNLRNWRGRERERRKGGCEGRKEGERGEGGREEGMIKTNQCLSYKNKEISF